MRKAFLLPLVVFLLCGCVSTRYVPVETVKTEYKTNTVHDSIYVERVAHDSVIIREHGDTVFVDRWHTEWRDRWRDRFQTDTLIVRDSIAVPYPVEKQLSRYQRIAIDLFGWLRCRRRRRGRRDAARLSFILKRYKMVFALH